LNYRAPATLVDVDQQLQALLRTADPDGVRLDSVAFAWKGPPELSIHADGAYRVATELIRSVHRREKLIRSVHRREKLVVAEVDDDLPPDKDYRRRSGADAVYRYALPPLLLQAFIQGTCRHLATWLGKLPDERHATAVNISATHDGIYLHPHDPALPREAIDELGAYARSRGVEVQCRGSASYEINATFADLLASEERSDLDGRRHIAAQAVAATLPGVAQIYLPSLLGLFSAPT
jgi:sucrose phosphorylase